MNTNNPSESAGFPNLNGVTLPKRSYMICSNYRSGSTLLASALNKTHVAGYPNEYFIERQVKYEKQVLKLDFQDWTENVEAYLSSLLQHYQTPNGVFGLKIMYADFHNLTVSLQQKRPDHNTNTLDLLKHFLPNLRFIYIYRRNKLRQAISMVKSSQSSIWHIHKDQEAPVYSDSLSFDRQQIDSTIETGIIRPELKWAEFFYRNDIQPMVVAYEDFIQNYEQTLAEALRFIDPPGMEPWNIGDPPLKQIADDINEAWYQQYKDQRGWLADPWIETTLKNNNYGPALLRLIDRERSAQKVHAQVVQPSSKAEEVQRQERKDEEAKNPGLDISQSIHHPAWIKDHIPWKILLQALLLKIRNLPERMLKRY